MTTGAAAEIKSKLSVVDVIAETVTLKRAGSTYKGLCPFHGEKTPSFVVTPERETWHCFGCGEGGDIFSFVMKRDGVEFREALRALGERAGVEVSRRNPSEDRRRARLREALEAAFGFYREVLLHARAGERAATYLEGRGFTGETLERFGIGYAPDEWQALTRRLSARGFTHDELLSAGLATRSSTGSPYDRFRGRVIFPIRDHTGGAIGMGGRILPGGEGPKYLNSPATPLFDKSRALYAIDLAKGPMRKQKLAVVVEGYTDVMAAHQAGFGNVVASLGTALTAGQVALATRYADAVALAFDVDLAGQAATERGLLDELVTAGQSVAKIRVIRVPAGKDPDELIRSDATAWARAVDEAKPVIEYFIEEAAASADLGSLTGRRDVSTRVLPLLRRVQDPVERNLYLQQLGRLVNVEPAVLAQAIDRQPRTRASAERRPMSPASDRRAVPVATSNQGLARGALPALEREALGLVLRHPSVAAHAADLVPLLRDSTARALLDEWRAWRESHPTDGASASATQLGVREFVEALDEPLADLARAVLSATPGERTDGRDGRTLTTDAGDAFRVCILRLRRERIDEAISDLRVLLEDAVRSDNPEDIEALEHRIDRLGREKADVTRSLSEPIGATGAGRG